MKHLNCTISIYLTSLNLIGFHTKKSKELSSNENYMCVCIDPNMRSIRTGQYGIQ